MRLEKSCVRFSVLKVPDTFVFPSDDKTDAPYLIRLRLGTAPSAIVMWMCSPSTSPTLTPFLQEKHEPNALQLQRAGGGPA